MMASDSLPAFGVDHCAALAATAVLSVGAAAWFRSRRDAGAGRATAIGLALGLLAGEAAVITASVRSGTVAVDRYLPLNLCDMALFATAAALLTRRAWLAEFAWFWAGSGTLLAMLTPDIDFGFPDWRYVAYFGLHGATIAGACGCTLGLGMRPRPGAWWRVLLFTHVYAGFCAVVNLVFGTNFMFLCRPPDKPTLLDAMGGWPWYLLSAEVVAIALLLALDRPWRGASGDAATGASSDPDPPPPE